MIVADGFWMLFGGALIIALGNGLVEAACNPLVAALYPRDKTVKLNQFHVWFPGGIVIGGVAAYLLDAIGIGAWQLKLALILVPVIIYGWLMLFEDFPATEGVQAGVSMGEMFKSTFTTPLMLLMLLCMAITASTELGPNRWIPAVLQAGGIPGILVLVWISGLMALLRFRAGAVVHRLSPTGVLLASAVVSAIGLYWLSYSESIGMAFASATVFAIGVCYFWPTMLGFVSERIPKSGALGLGMMGAVGMAVVGLVTSPQMGKVADQLAHQQLPPAETVEILMSVEDGYPALYDQVEEGFSADLNRTVRAVERALVSYEAEGELPPVTTANALRAVIDSRSAVQTAGNPAVEDLIDRAAAVLGPADNYGGRLSFRYIVPFTCLLIIVFGLLYLRDRQAGGYRAEHIVQPSKTEDQPDQEVS